MVWPYTSVLSKTASAGFMCLWSLYVTMYSRTSFILLQAGEHLQWRTHYPHHWKHGLQSCKQYLLNFTAFVFLSSKKKIQNWCFGVKYLIFILILFQAALVFWILSLRKVWDPPPPPPLPENSIKINLLWFMLLSTLFLHSGIVRTLYLSLRGVCASCRRECARVCI